MKSSLSTTAALIFGITFPSVITWVYFVALKGSPAVYQQSAYTIGKVLQFGFPLVFVFAIQRQRLEPREPRRNSIPLGLGFGAIIAGAMLALYWWWLKPAGFFTGPAVEVRSKISGMGLNETWKYVLLGTFYALFHSFLEEYYWRWFVFRELKTVTTVPWAVAISSIGFMAHHVLVLATYFGWQSPATYLFSAAVGIGGAIWAVLYDHARSLIAPWLSHCLVDAGIFVLGYDLVREIFQ